MQCLLSRSLWLALYDGKNRVVMEKFLSNDLYFRPAQAEDAQAVYTLSLQLAQHIEAPTPKFTEKQFYERYVGPNAPMRLILAIADEFIAGLVSWTVTYELYSGDSRIYISDLVVDQSMRGRKLGQALMNEVMNWAYQRDITKLGWEVWYRNESAKAFYRDFGARRDEEAWPYILHLS